MRELSQEIIKFDHEKNFKEEDFFISKTNKHILDFLNSWPKWEKNLVNINGENFSGKSHLVDIFLKKYKGIKFKAKQLNDKNIENIKLYQNIILEDLNEDINEKLIYSLYNIVEQEGKFLIITSVIPIVSMKFKLADLNSRLKNFLIQTIEKPDDELIYALLVKNLSDRQISIEKKLINYIIKRINRSYSKIFEFIYKIDEMRLKKKKSIDLKIIKEVLGE